jgi:uncharacterized protein (TIGR02646 family)
LSWRDGGNPDWRPAYSDLSGPPKADLHEALLREQGYICCYCGMGIAREDSHIEHLVPQHLNESLALDYNNLLASCLRRTVKTQPCHCGVLKGGWYDSALMVSPLSDDCEGRFRFDAYGAIAAHDDTDSGARETICRLGLNIDKLIAFRRKAIEGYLDILDSISSADLQKLVASLERKDTKETNGAFVPFCFAIAQVLRTLI